MSKPEYADEGMITKFTRCRTDLFALVEGKAREDAIQNTEHTLQFKRQDGEQFRRAFVDDNPLETMDSQPVYKNEITSITQLCEMLDAGDNALDEEFEEDEPTRDEALLADRIRIIDELIQDNLELSA